MKIYNNFLLSILIIGWSILSHAQCNLTATSSGGNLGYTQVYILVDQSGNIVAQNPTGTFNSVANGVYQIHALNYDPLNPPNPLPIALIGQPLTDVGSSTLGCFNGDLLTDYVTQVCSSCAQTLEFCGTEPVVITSSGSAVGYTQLYVLVDTSSGLVIATNLTGNFTSDVVIGNTYTVHALNYNSSDAPIPLPTVGQDVLQTGSTYQGCANSDFLLDYVCVNINALPDAPSASTTTQPDCLAPTGTITVTAPIGGVIEYSVDGITYQSSTVFSGLAPGDYNITAQDNVTLCTSSITVVTVDPVPAPPAEPATACYETATFNTISCVWDVTGTQPLEPATACYETATFNSTTCVWDVTGTQPLEPATACYETATFNTISCVWDVTGTQPLEPATACYETATFNTISCVWDVTGTQPLEPATACYETATFNTTSCVWDVTGTQPLEPATACYETATFNTSSCVWDVTGTQPLEPATACYETATFNTISCVWDVTGTQPLEPATACYETATFNTTSCVWDVTGTQPLEPATACYETATFNTTSCVWDVTGTQPLEPATACYETATFNTTLCVWDVTGTQPLEPATACYETATFNTTLCVWDVTGTQDSPPTVSTVQPDCINITGTINISAPTGANIEYSIDGITFQSSPTFSGLIPGNYDVVAQDVSIGCASISAPISIDNIPSAEQVDAGIDVFILQNESATLTASGNGTFLWSTNENTNSISVSPLVDTEYCVTLTDINNCTSNDCVTIFLTPEDEDCEELFIPTAFSPNNDNNNDLYQIRINASCVQSMSMLIFDRWGELIVEMTDPNESWDGTYKDEPLNTASFAYVLRIKLSNNPEEQEFKGNITLVK